MGEEPQTVIKLPNRAFFIGPMRSNKELRTAAMILGHLKEALRQDDYEVTGAHELCSPGAIKTQVFKRILTWDLVIADISRGNPNVMYELAARHFTGQPNFLIAEEGTVTPFNLTGQRVIFYDPDEEDQTEFRRKVYSAAVALREEHPDNPIWRAVDAVRRERRTTFVRFGAVFLIAFLLISLWLWLGQRSVRSPNTDGVEVTDTTPRSDGPED